MEICEDIRQTLGMKDLYAQRKETIERIFGTAKENHGFRYTQMYGKARMEMKVGLTFACMNLKKLAKIKAKWRLLKERKTLRNLILNKICFIKEKLLWNVNSRATLSTVCNIQRIFLIHSRMSQTYLITDYLISISVKKNTTICLIGNFSVHTVHIVVFLYHLKMP